MGNLDTIGTSIRRIRKLNKRTLQQLANETNLSVGYLSNIERNVTLVGGSTLPDVVNGNLILMAHSGSAYVSFFAYLYRLNVGDMAYVTYNGIKYKYQIVNIYNIPKTGQATITRNMDRSCMTLITCTKDSETEQTIYILEQV